MKLKMNVVIVYLLLVNANVFAGTQAIMQDNHQGKGAKETTQISVEGDLIRIDNSGDDGSQVIFNTAKKEMLMIDHEQKSFMRMNKAYFNKLQQKMEEARKQMQAQLASMPPQQREMMKKMMGDKLNLFAKPEKKVIKFIKTDRTDRAAGYACRVTEYLVNGKKTREFCITPENKIAGAEDIYQAMQRMTAMFKELYQSLSQTFPMMAETNPFSDIDQLDGFPIIITEISSNKRKQQSKLKSIQSKTFKKSFFEPPQGYKEKKMDMMGD